MRSGYSLKNSAPKVSAKAIWLYCIGAISLALASRVAFNPQTGRRSEVPPVGAFPAFAVAALADGTTGKLDELKAAWQRLGLREVRHLDLVFRLTRSAEPPTREETADALPAATTEFAAGEENVALAIRDALATFPADEVVLAVRSQDRDALTEVLDPNEGAARSIDGVPLRFVVVR